MKNTNGFLLFLLLLNPLFSDAQGNRNREVNFDTQKLVRAWIINGDTVPYIDLAEARVVADRKFKNKRQADKYSKLKRDVKKVYPYAILAAAKLEECNKKLERMPLEAQRKLYMKQVEQQLRQQFENDLKRLTMTQGRILIKLIDRQTGATSYDLVKELRGSFSAFMWQSIARLFGSNLKAEYDPNGDDQMIEQIIHLIEGGEI